MWGEGEENGMDEVTMSYKRCHGLVVIVFHVCNYYTVTKLRSSVVTY